MKEAEHVTKHYTIVELHIQMEHNIIKEIVYIIYIHIGMNINNTFHVNTCIYVHYYTYISFIEQILIFDVVLFYLE